MKLSKKIIIIVGHGELSKELSREIIGETTYKHVDGHQLLYGDNGAICTPDLYGEEFYPPREDLDVHHECGSDICFCMEQNVPIIVVIGWKFTTAIRSILEKNCKTCEYELLEIRQHYLL